MGFLIGAGQHWLMRAVLVRGGREFCVCGCASAKQRALYHS